MGQPEGPRGSSGRSTRCIALVGPFLSGKTTLLEAILARTGTINRQGKIVEKNTVGDASQEAREHGMSVELNFADAEFLGDRFTFVDCPGSVEFQAESLSALAACDAAVVVCEPDPKRVAALQVIFKNLEDNGIPHMLFLNKIDTFDTPVRDLVPILQPASALPLVLRQIPIWENGIATGFVDLALERAFVYREHAASEVIEMPAGIMDREQEARFEMLEKLADYDDELMEQLLSDMEPPRDRVFEDLSQEMRSGQICPVFLGSAENGNGIVRLLKALRHEAPFVETTVDRVMADKSDSAAYVIKSIHTPHAGKISVARVLSGEFADGGIALGPNGEDKVSGIFEMAGQEPKKRDPAQPGDVVGLGRLDNIATGETVTLGKNAIEQIETAGAPEPVFASAISVKDRKDEVKLTSALSKLSDEDPALRLEQNSDTHQMLLFGQGEMHLRVAAERLTRKYGVDVARGKRMTAVQGNDPQADHGARSPQEAVGWQWPVRGCRARHQTVAARFRLQVLRHDRRRRHSERLHSVRRGGREGLSRIRSAGLQRG